MTEQSGSQALEKRQIIARSQNNGKYVLKINFIGF